MKATVYALSAKGILERRSGASGLPVELGEILRQIDGHRTHAQLVADMRRSALTAGGLRWLKAAGYIEPTQPAVLSERQAPVSPTHGPSASQPASAEGVRPTGGANETRDALAQFMLQSIRRWLGGNGYPFHRQIEFANSVDDLLPHLNPLMDAIVARAGVPAGAEFADAAAFLMETQSANALPSR